MSATASNWRSAGVRAARCRLCSSGGPRRLSSSRHKPPSASLESCSRSTAGEASWRAWSLRMTNSSLWCSAAAKCRRRSCSVRAWGNQASTASTGAQRSACSVAHRGVALALGVPPLPAGAPPGGSLNHNRRRAASPWAAKAGTKGRCGGATSTTGPVPQRASAGASKRHSLCTPGACSSSVSAPTGQPPPGKCRSKSASPVATVRWGASAKAWARQTSACSASSASAAGALSSKNSAKACWATIFSKILLL